VCTLFGVVGVWGAIVFSVLLVGNVVMSGNRFLGSGWVGGLGMSIGVTV
jgi:hypothetical protein